MALQRVPVRPEYLVVGSLPVGVLALDALLPLGLVGSALVGTAAALVAGVALVPGAWSTLYRNTGVGASAWVLAASLAGGGVALSHLVGDPQPFCDGIGYRGCLTPYGYASAIFVASVLGTAIAVGHLDRYRRVRNASLTPAGEANAGTVAVEGRIVPAGPTAAGPVSGEPTVWYRCAVEEPTLFGGHVERDRETVGNDFYVEDGSGRILVGADQIDAHDAAEHARSDTETGDGRRRREWSFQPGDAVTVVGRATAVSRGGSPDPVVGLEAPVIAGNQSLDGLRGWAAQRVVAGGALALGIGTLSLIGMLLTA